MRVLLDLGPTRSGSRGARHRRRRATFPDYRLTVGSAESPLAVVRGQESGEGVAIDHLFLDEHLREQLERAPLFSQRRLNPEMSGLEQPPHLHVDHPGSIVAVFALA